MAFTSKEPLISTPDDSDLPRVEDININNEKEIDNIENQMNADSETEIDNIEQYVNDLEKKGVKVDTTEMSDKKFPESLVGPKTGNGVVLQLTGWKEGPFDATYEGCDRLCEKYTQNPKLKLIVGNQLKK